MSALSASPLVGTFSSISMAWFCCGCALWHAATAAAPRAKARILAAIRMAESLNTCRGQLVAGRRPPLRRSVAVCREAARALVGVCGEIRLGEEPAVLLEAMESRAGNEKREAGLVGDEVRDAALAALADGGAAAIVHHGAARFSPNPGMDVHFAPAEHQPDGLAAGILRQQKRTLTARQRNAIAAAAIISGSAIFLGPWTGPLALSGQCKREQDHVSPPHRRNDGGLLP